MAEEMLCHAAFNETDEWDTVAVPIQQLHLGGMTRNRVLSKQGTARAIGTV